MGWDGMEVREVVGWEGVEELRTFECRFFPMSFVVVGSSSWLSWVASFPFFGVGTSPL
jgi:hypothetical protein